MPLLAACGPDPGEADFRAAYDELVLDSPGFPDAGTALDAGRAGCQVLARDNSADAVDAATRAVADRLDADPFLSTLVVALAAQTLCPDDAPDGFPG